MGAKAEQSARTRASLIDAATTLFGERGYRATSLKAIAQRASITHGVIPFHFGSKEGLLIAVVEHCFSIFQGATWARLGDRERDFGLGDLRAFVDAQLAFQRERPEIGRLFQLLLFEAIGPSPELRPYFHEFRGRVHALGCAWLRAGQAEGALRSDLDVEATVDALLSFFTGVKTHALLEPEGFDVARVQHQLLALLEGGVTHRESNDEAPRALKKEPSHAR